MPTEPDQPIPQPAPTDHGSADLVHLHTTLTQAIVGLAEVAEQLQQHVAQQAERGPDVAGSAASTASQPSGGTDGEAALVPMQREPHQAQWPVGDPMIAGLSTEELTLPPPTGAVWPNLRDAATEGSEEAPVRRRRARHAAG